MFNNLTFYMFTKPVDLRDLDLALEGRPCPVIGPQDSSRQGWCEPIDGGGFVFRADEPRLLPALICLRIDEKVLPSDVVRKEVSARAAEMEKEQGRPLRRKERNQIREDVTFELLPRAFVRSKYVYAYLTEQYIAVASASSGTCETLLSELRETLGSLPVRSPAVYQSPSFVITNWIAGESGGPLSQSLTIGDRCSMAGYEQEAAAFRNMSPYDEDVKNLLHHGLFVTEIQLAFQDALSFTLTDDFRFKRIAVGEALHAAMDECDPEDRLQRAATEFFLFQRSADEAFSVLVNEFGGLDTP